MEAHAESKQRGSPRHREAGAKCLLCDPPPSYLYPAADTLRVQTQQWHCHDTGYLESCLQERVTHCIKPGFAVNSSSSTVQVSLFLVSQNKMLQAPFC